LAIDWIVVGLGNPGPRYEGTRHSIGRVVVRLVAERTDARFDNSRFNALFGLGQIGESRLCVALPLRYMNESGAAVGPLARFYKVAPSRVLVIYDDLDLPLGKVRIRAGGGSGGNRGALSVARALGTDGFPRVRVGIGRPPEGWDAADYVLAPFPAADRPIIDAAADTAASAAVLVVTHGVEAAMNMTN
jgi:PTH1 family peptidyl-tRNA hydrolase